MTTFGSLRIGQVFDFVNDANPTFNSFYLPCRKISDRRYVDETGAVHRVGSIQAAVYHVDGAEH